MVRSSADRITLGQTFPSPHSPTSPQLPGAPESTGIHHFLMKKRDCHQHSREREWLPPSTLGSSLSGGLTKASVGLNRRIKFDPSTAVSEGPGPPPGAGQGGPLIVLELDLK